MDAKTFNQLLNQRLNDLLTMPDVPQNYRLSVVYDNKVALLKKNFKAKGMNPKLVSWWFNTFKANDNNQVSTPYDLIVNSIDISDAKDVIIEAN